MTRQIILALLFAIAAMPAHAADEKGLYQSLYYIPCAKYSKDREQPKNTGHNAVDQIYISGWLTAYNYMTPNTYDILPNHNIDTVMEWMDDFCKKNKAKSLESGLLQLTGDLYPSRIQKAPEQPKKKSK